MYKELVPPPPSVHFRRGRPSQSYIDRIDGRMAKRLEIRQDGCGSVNPVKQQHGRRPSSMRRNRKRRVNERLWKKNKNILKLYQLVGKYVGMVSPMKDPDPNMRRLWENRICQSVPVYAGLASITARQRRLIHANIMHFGVAATLMKKSSPPTIPFQS